MRKVIVLCLIVLFTSCKDKDKNSTPDPDYAPEYVGSYTTETVNGPETILHEWVISNITEKNVLNIDYTRRIKISTSGTVQDIVLSGKLSDVKVTGSDTFDIDEVVDVNQTGAAGVQKQRFTGKGTRASDTGRLSITLKIANVVSGVSNEEYLVFKKK